MQSDLVSRSSILGADPLSDVLSLVKTSGFMCGGLDIGGAWSYGFEADGAFRCFAVVSGTCWLSLGDGPEPLQVSEGEVFALPHGRRFSLASDPTIAPSDIYSEVDGPLNGRILSLQGGGGACLFGALFTFRQDFAAYLTDALPAVLHIRDCEDRAVLRVYLDRMMALLRYPQPGSVLVTANLAETLLIEVLRLHLANGAGRGMSWLSALSDERLSRAVAAMHEQPARRWTVEQLAVCAGMSRSAFALRFSDRVGVSVMQYLIRWRMLLAADRLVASTDPVGAIGGWLGYESESAFIFAFRRELGCTPRQYRHRSIRAE